MAFNLSGEVKITITDCHQCPKMMVNFTDLPCSLIYVRMLLILELFHYQPLSRYISRLDAGKSNGNLYLYRVRKW